MQLVILSAGRGSRMGSLTNDVPKSLLLFEGKTLLEHKLDNLPLGVTEVVIVVGYLGEKIVAMFGDTYKGIPLRYVKQEVLDGTGGALHCVRDVVTGTFLVLMGDDVYDKSDLERLSVCEWGNLVSVANMSMRGCKLEVVDGKLVSLYEGAQLEVGDYINAGAYKLQSNVFDFPLVRLEGKEEYGLPQTLASQVGNISLEIVVATQWRLCNEPSDLV